MRPSTVILFALGMFLLVASGPESFQWMVLHDIAPEQAEFPWLTVAGLFFVVLGLLSGPWSGWSTEHDNSKSSNAKGINDPDGDEDGSPVDDAFSIFECPDGGSSTDCGGSSSTSSGSD